jgi:peptide/nickel transport system substrate-binding protein
MDPKWTKVIAVVVVLVLIIAGVAIYYVRQSSSGSSCTLGSTNPLIVDQAEQPDHLDPAVTFTTPGWALVQQVYQGMVNYHGNSSTVFDGILAKNWSVTSDGMHWTFYLRSGVHFSNGDPYNAYVQWFSLYRTLVMNAPPSFILGENFWFPNQSWYASDGVSENWNDTSVAQLASELNGWNFFTPSSSEIAVMQDPGQSFQVINNLTIRLNLGNGYLGTAYAYLLASLAAPTSFAVDPSVVRNNSVNGVKGVIVNGTDPWMEANMLGTGQYTLQGSYTSSAGGYVLEPNAQYWGTVAAGSEPDNNLLQPAQVSVQVNFQKSAQIAVQDLGRGAAAEASFAYVGPSTVADLGKFSCVKVEPLDTVYGSTSGGWWIYMNQSTYPFNNLSVRAAVVHAINYSQIIQLAFGGAATQWVGPVPPGYPDYNPDGLTPYTYDLALAQQEIAQSPCANSNCSGLTINYAYIDLGDWQTVATILKNDLQAIGININPVKISLDQLFVEQAVDPQTGVCTAQENSGGLGPFPMGQEFYTSDYIAPDDWTQNNAINYGTANMCMSGYNNDTVNALVLAAASETDPAVALQDYKTITSLMYNNYTDAWLVIPTQYAVYNTLVQGVVHNPMASGEPFAISFNTQHA